MRCRYTLQHMIFFLEQPTAEFLGHMKINGKKCLLNSGSQAKREKYISCTMYIKINIEYTSVKILQKCHEVTL